MPYSDAVDLPSVIASFSGTTTHSGKQYRNADTTLQCLTEEINTSLHSYRSNTAVVADVASDTVERQYVSNRTTHVGVQCTPVMIDSEAVPLMSRRANSTPPPSPASSAATGHETGSSSNARYADRLQTIAGVPTNIPQPTYQSTRFDEKVLPERCGDGYYDNGHVVKSRKRIVSRQLCTFCRGSIIYEGNTVDSKDSPALKTRTQDEGGQRAWAHDEGIAGSTGTGNAAGIPELRTAKYVDRGVGEALPVVECGVGIGSAWTESRGIGDGILWTAEVGTSTVSASVVERAVGTRTAQLVHKNEATDSQMTASVGTNPAEDITSAYRGLLAAAQPRRVTVSRGTSTPRVAASVDRETETERRRLVDRGTCPAVDVAAAYRGAVAVTGSRVTVSRGTLTDPMPTRSVDRHTATDCDAMVDRASSPIKVSRYFYFVVYRLLAVACWQ